MFQQYRKISFFPAKNSKIKFIAEDNIYSACKWQCFRYNGTKYPKLTANDCLIAVIAQIWFIVHSFQLGVCNLLIENQE